MMIGSLMTPGPTMRQNPGFFVRNFQLLLCLVAFFPALLMPYQYYKYSRRVSGENGELGALNQEMLMSKEKIHAIGAQIGELKDQLDAVCAIEMAPARERQGIWTNLTKEYKAEHRRAVSLMHAKMALQTELQKSYEG